MVALVASSIAVAVAQEPRTADEVSAVALARRTLADRLRVPAEVLIVRRVSPVEWRDSSLGCPERGQVYRPQIVAGHDVRLTHDGREHEVHVGAGRAVVCGSADAGAKVSAGAVLAPAQQAAHRVKEQVAARAGVAVADVRIDRSRPFRGASPPCPAAPPQARGPAFVIEARAGGASYVYYADDDRVLSCAAAVRSGRL